MSSTGDEALKRVGFLEAKAKLAVSDRHAIVDRLKAISEGMDERLNELRHRIEQLERTCWPMPNSCTLCRRPYAECRCNPLTHPPPPGDFNGPHGYQVGLAAQIRELYEWLCRDCENDAAFATLQNVRSRMLQLWPWLEEGGDR